MDASSHGAKQQYSGRRFPDSTDALHLRNPTRSQLWARTGSTASAGPLGRGRSTLTTSAPGCDSAVPLLEGRSGPYQRESTPVSETPGHSTSPQICCNSAHTDSSELCQVTATDIVAIARVWEQVGRPAYQKFYSRAIAPCRRRDGTSRAPPPRVSNRSTVTLLLTFPNSGTTWARRVFERGHASPSATVILLTWKVQTPPEPPASQLIS